VAKDPSAGVQLASLRDERPLTLHAWLTLFNMLGVVLDPYTRESGWIILTADRIFAHYAEADVRCAFIVTADPAGAREFLGPYADRWLVLLDPERELVRSMELERLPALVHLRQDCSIAGVAEGWHHQEWNEVLDGVEQIMAWRSQPTLPHPLDPGPFAGTSAVG